jgi:CheY-like chemotaxis protein
MANNKSIKILLADDEATITRIYSVGLRAFFSPANEDLADKLEADLFGSMKAEKPAAEIETCRQGEEAVERFREAQAAGAPFDIVVLDIRMPPGIDGVEAAKQIRTMDPGAKILFVSGYSDYEMSALQEQLPPPSHMDFMEKPVKLADLASRIVEFTGLSVD